MASSHPRRAAAVRGRIPARRRPWAAIGFALLTGAALVAAPVAPAAAATAIGLGTATSFAVLAGAGITNIGTTTIVGDVGSSPTPSMTGFSGANNVVLTGTNHGNDAVATKAKDDLTVAYTEASAASPPVQLGATELGGRTLTPGVYHHDTLGITGTLSLDTQGNPDAVFVFQADTTLVTAAASRVVVLNGATTCNVFWKVGTSATLGASSRFVGSVLADQSISAGNATTVEGRLLARSGAVTLDTNTITRPTCAAALTPVTTTTTAPITTTTTGGAAAAATTVGLTTTDGSGSVSGAPATTSATAPAAAPSPPTTASRTTATTGPGATTAGLARPPLAVTGGRDGLTTLAVVLIGGGAVLVGGSRRRRPAGAHYR